MLPWALYNLTSRDQGSPLIRPFFVRDTGVAAGPATIVTNTSTIPAEQMLLLTSVSISTIGGTGWVFQQAEWSALEIDSGLRWGGGRKILQTGAGGLGLAQGDATWLGSPLAVISGDRFTLELRMIGSLATNIDFHFAAAGVLIPRGTLSLT